MKMPRLTEVFVAEADDERGRLIPFMKTFSKKDKKELERELERDPSKRATVGDLLGLADSEKDPDKERARLKPFTVSLEKITKKGRTGNIATLNSPAREMIRNLEKVAHHLDLYKRDAAGEPVKRWEEFLESVLG